MKRRSFFMLWVSSTLLTTPLWAAPADGPSTAEVNAAEAEVHFAHARELYQEGRYAEAKAALLEARKLDPAAKDLVYNLGIVAEKMQDFDEAIEYLRQYQTMDSVTEAESQRADASIRRIEGARQHIKPQPNEPEKRPDPTPIFVTPAKPARGRVDAWTVSSLGVAGAGLVSGAVFGVLALSQKPSGTVQTGESMPWQQVQTDNDRARTFGLVADVSLGVGIVALAASGVLYFTRTKDPHAKSAFTPGSWRLTF